MRRMRGALLVLLTAVLVAGGAMLPYIASLVQDRYLESEVDVWTFDPVGLRLGDEPAVWPALCLMAGECEWLGWNSETNLSEEEARLPPGRPRSFWRRAASRSQGLPVLSWMRYGQRQASWFPEASGASPPSCGAAPGMWWTIWGISCSVLSSSMTAPESWCRQS